MSCLWVFFIIPFGVSGAQWSDKPWINVNSSDIEEGEWIKVLCGVPIDYTGGFCRLYRDNSKVPIQSLQTNDYVCKFLVSEKDLLAGRPYGSRTSVRCDYTLQNYVSVPSDNKAVVVWGTARKPKLTVSPRVVMMGGKVKVQCSTPRNQILGCRMYRNGVHLDEIPCHHEMTAEKLMSWQTTSIFNEIDLSCKYDKREYVISKASNPIRILVVDPTKLRASTNHTFVCDVPARVQDFVLSQGNTSLSLELGGTLTLEAVNNSTGPFNQTCRVI
ncbi:hypothetical protein AAFF_G00019510 [Aldrovandia affinis]|uniref:Uncharacterized protein n=1 Tax=Aldrovandia affinis TaxID=143900 RepID=A0AAD7WHM5_9TELE|nr:hypothetical protein AAFF_G00019510 [Aldrovandia affinis]